MAVNNSNKSILFNIFQEAFSSSWLAIVFLLNVFLSGFLLPTEYLEAGYTMHHWDFVIGVTGSLFLLAFRFVYKSPSFITISGALVTSGIAAALVPYLWAFLILPNGIPEEMGDKWIYSINGPVAQIVGLAIVIGSLSYARKTSNSVAEKRSALNILRRDMEVEIELERKRIIESILAVIKPAIERVDANIKAGLDSEKISDSINQIIAGIIRPLSHNLDSSASHVAYEIDRRLIKRSFRKNRFRHFLRSRVPLFYAVNAPLSFFGYINFNLTTISYIHGFDVALQVSLPFLIFSAFLFLIFNKAASARDSKASLTIVIALSISFIQTCAFFLSISLFGSNDLIAEAPAFALMTFLFTFIPAILGLVLTNLRLNLEHESTITEEISENLSLIRGRLWSLRKKFARELHGGLQSKMQILALKIDDSRAEEPDLTGGLSAQLKETLAIDDLRGEAKAFSEQIFELIEFWNGITSISLECNQALLHAIDEDALLAECLIEVIREAINNAVKHSAATEISIRMRESAPKKISLDVENNILKTVVLSEQGSLGTAIYKELSHTWELSSTSSHVKLSATFIQAR